MSDFPLLNKGKTTDRCAPAEFLHANVPEACPVCPTAADLESHFRAYADHYKLHSYIKYDTAITRIERDYTENKWNLHVRGPNGSSVVPVDKVVAANGIQNKAVMPACPGIENYSGVTMHSQAFKYR